MTFEGGTGYVRHPRTHVTSPIISFQYSPDLKEFRGLCQIIIYRITAIYMAETPGIITAHITLARVHSYEDKMY